MQSLLMNGAATPSASEPDWVRTDTIFVPFLGQVFDVQSRDEALLVAQVSVNLRAADFALLSPKEFGNLISSVTALMPKELATRIKERAEAVRRGDW